MQSSRRNSLIPYDYITKCTNVNVKYTLEFPQFGMAGKRGVIHRRKSREKVAKKRKKVKNYLLKCGRIKVPSKTLLNKKEGNSS